jgi:TonB family protein
VPVCWREAGGDHMNLGALLKPWSLAALTACTATIASTSAGLAAYGVVDPANQPVPVVSTHVQPPYPEISRRLGERGKTVLRVEIDEHGSVIDDYVRRSSGSDRLDHTALTFVKDNWRWQPPSNRCRPVAAVTEVEIGWPD